MKGFLLGFALSGVRCKLPIALQCQICAIGGAGRKSEHTNWKGIREPTSRAIDFLPFERHYRHRRRHVSPCVGRCLKASFREADTEQLVPPGETRGPGSIQVTTPRRN